MKIKEIISAIRHFKSEASENKQKKNKLLESIRPSIIKMHNGEWIYGIVKELIFESDYNGAVEFIKKSYRFSLLWPVSRIKWPLLMAIWILTGGLVLIFSSVYDRFYAKQSINWQATGGRVIKSYVKEYIDPEDNRRSYKDEIEYTYKVNGKNYASSRRTFNEIILGEGLGGKKIAEDIVKRYPKESIIIVYYNPDSPGMSVIDNRDVPAESALIKIITGIIIIAGTAIFIVIYMRRRLCPGCRKFFTRWKIKIVSLGRPAENCDINYCDLYECIKCGHRWEGDKYQLED